MLNPNDITNEQERREKILKDYLYSEEYQSKLKERLKIQDAGMRSPEARKNIFYLCQRPDNPAEGCIFFIENFGWTFNPKMEMKHFPFILFECQKRAIRAVVEHIDKGRDVFIEKSREMGVSWLVFCYIAYWYWLFREGSNGLLGSYKEKLVDDRSIDSLFGKIDYALTNTPEWMLPVGFIMKKHRTKLKLANPENGNIITGDTMNPNFGRGSRKTYIAFDELAFWDYAKDAWESAGDATNCRIANSTPNGYDYYAMLRDSGIDIVTLHWREHPLKDNQWYAYECKRRTEEEIAQELDISYTKSKVGRVYQEWNDNNVLIGKYEYDENLPLYVFWDFGKTDDTAMIWAQPSREGLRIIDVYRNTGKNIDFYIPFVTGMIYGDITYTYKQEELDIISVRKNWKNATHFGDPAGRFQNSVTDDTILSILRKYSIIINFRDKWKEFKIRKHEAKLLIMNRILLNDNIRTRYFNLCMIQASYPIVKVNGVGEVRSESPKHDSTSHYRSAFEYGAIGLSEQAERVHNVFDKSKKRDRVTRTWVRRSTGY
jgi:hypothetical protein